LSKAEEGLVSDVVLDRVLGVVRPGPLLYVGCLSAARAIRCRRRGFEVTTVAFAPAAVVECPPHDLAGLVVTERTVDRAGMDLSSEGYGVVVLAEPLSHLPPTEGERLIAAARRATRPGGAIYAAAYATGDPRFEALRAGGQSLGRHTVRTADGRVLRFFLTGELAMAFEGWLLLHAAERRLDGPARVVSDLVARRPSTGTLLA